MAETSELRTLLFRVGRAVYGCDIGVVREIVPQRPATRLPGSAPYVVGLVNLRGTMLTVIDLGLRFEPGAARTAEGSIIVVEVQGRRLGLVVGDVMDVSPIAVERPSDRGADDIQFGLGHLNGTVVIVLDLAALMRQVLL